MPFTNVNANTWTSVTTTTEDTIFQNRGAHTVYVTAEVTAGLDAGEGIAVGPGEAVVITSGKDVSVHSGKNPGVVFYTGV